MKIFVIVVNDTTCVENCEGMTSSPHPINYSDGLVKKCFPKIWEISKCHNFPIFIRFSSILHHSVWNIFFFLIKLCYFEPDVICKVAYDYQRKSLYVSTFRAPLHERLRWHTITLLWYTKLKLRLKKKLLIARQSRLFQF